MVNLFLGSQPFFVVISVTHFGEKSSNAQGGTRLGIIRRAVLTQKARVCGVFSDDEVGAVVKASITVAAQAEFVLFTLRITLFVSKFDSGSMAGTGHNTGSNCRSRSGIPVVSRSGGHCCLLSVVAWELHYV
jgi:hypothetical protein